MDRLKKWIVALAITALAVTSAYQWVDRPTAFFAHDHLRQFKFFGEVPKVSEFLFSCSVLVFLFVGIRTLLGRPLSKWHTIPLLCSLSLVVSETIKNELKYVFGRTWPDTWTHNNPSLIHDGVYGFNPFHYGDAFGSFPSGHTAAICAVMSVLSVSYPKFRALWLLAVVAVAVGLVGANYHFVSDIIAGGFIGASTGWVTVILWEAHHRSPQLRSMANADASLSED
jgi:membrane-associated phospholipid phosphatase